MNQCGLGLIHSVAYSFTADKHVTIIITRHSLVRTKGEVFVLLYVFLLSRHTA